MAVTLDPEALTTVAAVRDGFSTPSSDSEVIRKINHISRRFSDRTGRKWAFFTYDSSNPEYIQGQGRRFLYVTRKPIVTVTQIVVGQFTYPSPFTGWTVTDYIRTPQFDAQGKIHRAAGWVMMVGEWDRLTGDSDLRRSSQQFSVQIQYAGGYILPRYDGVHDAVYNPSTAACNWPYEDYAIREVRNLIRKPFSGLIEQRTAGGWSQRYSDKNIIRPSEFESETEAWLDSESRPGALFR